jgi:hypothetical protein
LSDVEQPGGLRAVQALGEVGRVEVLDHGSTGGRVGQASRAARWRSQSMAAAQPSPAAVMAWR